MSRVVVGSSRPSGRAGQPPPDVRVAELAAERDGVVSIANCARWVSMTMPSRRACEEAYSTVFTAASTPSDTPASRCAGASEPQYLQPATELCSATSPPPRLGLHALGGAPRRGDVRRRRDAADARRTRAPLAPTRGIVMSGTARASGSHRRRGRCSTSRRCCRGTRAAGGATGAGGAARVDPAVARAVRARRTDTTGSLRCGRSSPTGRCGRSARSRTRARPARPRRDRAAGGQRRAVSRRPQDRAGLPVARPAGSPSRPTAGGGTINELTRANDADKQAILRRMATGCCGSRGGRRKASPSRRSLGSARRSPPPRHAQRQSA